MKKLFWTNKIPRKPGWYWFKDFYKEGEPHEWICPVLVALDESSRDAVSDRKLIVIDRYFWDGNGDAVCLKEWLNDEEKSFMWAGPIKMPANATKRRTSSSPRAK